MEPNAPEDVTKFHFFEWVVTLGRRLRTINSPQNTGRSPRLLPRPPWQSVT